MVYLISCPLIPTSAYVGLLLPLLILLRPPLLLFPRRIQVFWDSGRVHGFLRGHWLCGRKQSWKLQNKTTIPFNSQRDALFVNHSPTKVNLDSMKINIICWHIFWQYKLHIHKYKSINSQQLFNLINRGRVMVAYSVVIIEWAFASYWKVPAVHGEILVAGATWNLISNIDNDYSTLSTPVSIALVLQ